MTRVELAVALAGAGVNPAVYSLEGGLPNDTYCIDRAGGSRWVVYYSERGSKFNERFFNDESGACHYLLQTLVGEPSALLPEFRDEDSR